MADISGHFATVEIIYDEYMIYIVTFIGVLSIMVEIHKFEYVPKIAETICSNRKYYLSSVFEI